MLRDCFKQLMVEGTPPFLEQSRENWPNQLSCPKNSEDILEEARQELRKSEINTLGTQQVDTDQHFPSMNTVIPCENYSSLTRLLRVTAPVQRFIKLMKVGTNYPQIQLELASEDLSQLKLCGTRKCRPAQRIFRNLVNTWECLKTVVESYAAKVGYRIPRCPTMPSFLCCCHGNIIL